MHQDARTSPTDRPGEHRPQIDGLRFLAFLGIFLFHCNSGRFPAGQLGVPFFFALSGFLITRILLRNESDSPRRDLATFYARRTLRIFPLYYAALLVLLACGQLARPMLSFTYLYNFCIYTNRAFIGNAGHFWTLCVEEQFYLVFPLALIFTAAHRRAAMLAGLMVACAASRMLLDRFNPSQYTFVLPNASGEYLVAGAIAGYLDVIRPGIASSLPRMAIALILSAFAALWVCGRHFGMPWLAPIVPELTALGFSLLIWELWRSRGPMSRVLGVRPLAYLGKISYGCYVLHAFALQGNRRLISTLHLDFIPPSARSFVALAVTILAAMASWHFFEAPILSLKSRFSYGRPSGRCASSATKATRRRPVPA